MAKKQQNLNDKLNSDGISIALPIGHLSMLSNIDNINYALDIIKEYSNKNMPVVGFDVIRSLGVRERNYRLFSQKRAKEFKKENPFFDYVTRKTILVRKKDIEKGKYKINNGIIVGINS